MQFKILALLGSILGFAQNMVGAILDLSGANVYYGKAVREGIELALDEIKDDTVSVVYEDHRLNANEAVKAFQSIILKKPKAVITMSSMSSVPINPLANEHRLIQLAVLSWATNYSTPNDFSFRLDITTDTAAKEVCDFFQRKHFSKVVLLSIKTSFGTSMKESVKKICQTRIVSDFDYLESDRDINSLALKAIRNSPDLVYVIDHRPSMIADFLKRLRTLNYSGPFYSGTLGQDELFIKTAGDFAEGSYYIYVASNEQKIFDIYEKRYNKIPLNPYLVSLGYESIKIIHSAFKSYGDVECARDKLYTSEFD
ncbi:MAG: ABC transporter substrate-binding protein, partial [Deltaproteobacteria bacterium]|nr:ABC transporter substrate-binding protein [Deltaproteobacteria bacterium]